MMLEFKKRELQFKFDGALYKLRYPNVEEMSDYTKTHKDSEDKFDTVINFLDKLGLKKETSMKMEVNHLTTIVKELTAAKK